MRKIVAMLAVAGMLAGCMVAGPQSTGAAVARGAALGALDGAMKAVGLDGLYAVEDDELTRLVVACTTATAVMTVWQLDLPVLEDEGRRFCAAVYAENLRRMSVPG